MRQSFLDGGSSTSEKPIRGTLHSSHGTDYGTLFLRVIVPAYVFLIKRFVHAAQGKKPGQNNRILSRDILILIKS